MHRPISRFAAPSHHDAGAADLNAQQREAVQYIEGPSLVLAGAGSGKTRVIAYKLARLLQAGIAPQRIAAITFTNKAAAEMRERARALVGKAAAAMRICTFHALGVHILRESGQALGLKPQFSIVDAADVQGMLKELGGSTDKSTVRHWQFTISRWKGDGLNAAQAQAQAQTADERQIAAIMQRYEERLLACQAVDFDDLLTLPLRVLQEHSEPRLHWQAQMRHVLVDEYQDTNASQYALLRWLTGAAARFTVVGDDDQSIYGWRGATLDNLRQLPRDYPELRVIKLEQNYRSTTAILQAANAVIAPNDRLFAKTLFSQLGAGEPVRVVACEHEEHEAQRAVARVQALRSQHGAREFSDFAILYRANHMSRVFEQALSKAQIPYKVSGGIGFFDRAEVRDLCAWLRLWANNDDDPAFMRAATTPKRGIGHQTLQQLGQFATQYRLSLFEALFSPALGNAVSARGVESLHEFGRLINDLQYQARHIEGQEAALAFLLDWLKTIGYEQYLLEQENNSAMAAARYGNVLHFCQWLAARCGGQLDDTAAVRVQQKTQTLLAVAQTVSLLSTLNKDERNPNVVTLSTLHAAKGLEWAHVILAGVNEGVLPLQRGDGMADVAADSDSQALAATSAHQLIEEERRLMYVGVTRARQTLTVSYCKLRGQGFRGATARGAPKMSPAQPSRFIADMQLNQAVTQENPLEKLRQLRAEFAQKAQAEQAADKAAASALSAPSSPQKTQQR